MTDAQFERELRDWFAGREPGPLPTSLRDLAARVPFETPVPIARRAWQAIVRPADPGGTSTSLRLALVLALVGALVAIAVGSALVASQPTLVPEVSGWRDFEVGRPAPAIEFRSVGGALADHDDATLEFEDMVGSLVVMYVPDPDAQPGPTDVGDLVEATLAAPGPNAFVVAAPAEWSAALASDPRIVPAEPPASWLASRSERGPAIVVVDRSGVVIAAFAGSLPTADQLGKVLSRAEAER